MNFPSLKLEKFYENLIVAGIDEVGRGPWAGPLVAAAVILNEEKIPVGVNDSKKVNAKLRNKLFEELISVNDCGVGIVHAEEIDELGLTRATKKAMQLAFMQLSSKPDVALIDGIMPAELACIEKCVVGGDAKSLSIAAASIIAKVTRDKIMHELAKQYPEYGWEENVGYGTKKHQESIIKHGITPFHRKSFKPIKKIIEYS